MTDGTGYLDVTIEALTSVVALLPRTYQIIGSHESKAEGQVRLKLSSCFLVGDANEIICTVTDAGSTRKVLVLPA